MSARIRSRLTFANVISLIALFVALGGTGYAAITLPKNSVTSKTIKKGAVTNAKLGKNAVTSSKVKNGSLLKADFANGQLPAGPQGPQGIQGPPGTNGTNGTNGTDGAQGPAGIAAAYARVAADGTLLPTTDPANFPNGTKDIDASVITNPAAGTYCFTGMTFKPASALVSLDNAGASTAGANNFSISAAIERGSNLGGCPTGANARVVTTQWSDTVAPANVNHGFIIWFEK
jgi:hypothetical protein